MASPKRLAFSMMEPLPWLLSNTSARCSTTPASARAARVGQCVLRRGVGARAEHHADGGDDRGAGSADAGAGAAIGPDVAPGTQRLSAGVDGIRGELDQRLSAVLGRGREDVHQSRFPREDGPAGACGARFRRFFRLPSTGASRRGRRRISLRGARGGGGLAHGAGAGSSLPGAPSPTSVDGEGLPLCRCICCSSALAHSALGRAMQKSKWGFAVWRS